ncbi:hypothetical protein E4U53_004603 [Claviceps sorghi]|nr:hypothetical protein E4U53_004603 [Claviceps sorghi]
MSKGKPCPGVGRSADTLTDSLVLDRETEQAPIQAIARPGRVSRAIEEPVYDAMI